MRVRQIVLRDIYCLNRVNLDLFTENYNLRFYSQYLASWPNLCLAAEANDGTIVGYVFGKIEGDGSDWHGHITAISIATEFRGLGVADQLLDRLEGASWRDDAHYVDLYVRASNEAGLKLYERRGYKVHEVLSGYYSDGEAAYDMRKYRASSPSPSGKHDAGKVLRVCLK